MNPENNQQVNQSQVQEMYHSREYQDDEINLRELFDVVWKGKLWIISITVIFAVGSLIYALSLPNIYKSEAKLAPTEEASGGGLSGMAGQLGGLASLAGVNISKSGTDKTTIAIEVMQSRVFLTEFVKKYDILPELMAVKKWTHSGGLVYNLEYYNPETGVWVREVESPKQVEPTSWEYIEVLRRDVLSVGRDKETGLVTVTVEHLSPVLAKQWVDWLVTDVNQYMRDRDIQEAQRSLEYLNNELSKTSLSNMQQVFYQLIEKQTQTIMMANVRPEYIFQTLDPAVVPEEKAKPSRALICIMGTFFGGFLGVVFVLIRNILRRQVENKSAKVL